MKAYRVEEPIGLDGLKLVDLPEPVVGSRDVLVQIYASSLNYRDTIVLKGGYSRNDKQPVIPLSDGSGVVIAVGQEVTQFQVGDEVLGCFLQKWVDGEVDEIGLRSGLGGGLDGVLAEQVAFPEQALVTKPASLTHEQAACLPCAGVTAWQALTLANMQPGQSLLTLGTGGVSIFALQLGKAFGTRVLITSSSDEKLERARQLGADETINYRQFPEWHRVVRERTDGLGVHHVIEVGGPGTLERSLKATRLNGVVSLIGVLTGVEANASVMLALFNRLTIRGIYVGSRAMFEAMNHAIEANAILPVVDRVFPFDEANAAYAHLMSGQHFGKVVIRHV